jgi:hypothetical protein
MELPTKERSPRPPQKAVIAAPHQARGLMTCRRVAKTSRGRHNKITVVVHSRTMHKAATPYSPTLSRLNLALTLKACVKAYGRDQLALWIAWRSYLMCMCFSLTLAAPNDLGWLLI